MHIKLTLHSNYSKISNVKTNLTETPLQTEQSQIRQPFKELPDQGLHCLGKYDISNPTQVDLRSNIFVLCINMNKRLN